MALLTRIKTSLTIPAHRKVQGLLDGAYASIHAGRSLDFSDLRTYVIGDDIKDIDWKASARLGEPLIKRYVADRKHTLMVVVPSGATFAAMSSPTDTKIDVAIMAAGLFGFLATNHGDYVTICHSGADGIELPRPSTRDIELERMLQSLQKSGDAAAAMPDPEAVLKYVVTSMRRKTIMLIIMEDVEITPSMQVVLSRLAVQHEIFHITVKDLDPTDPKLQSTATTEFGNKRLLPRFVSADRALHEAYQRELQARQDRRNRVLDRLGIVHTTISKQSEVITAVMGMLERMRHAVVR